jgi:putative DNA primase/helicase
VASNLTEAVLFRAVEVWAPTLLIDEADTLGMAENKELRGTLNSGHERRAAFVLRCVGDDHAPKQFTTWCPKAIALIGKLPPTLHNRTIIIEMQRRKPHEAITPLPRSDAYREVRHKCARWCRDNIEALRCADPAILPELNDRAADNWRPLLAIADAVGGDWPAWAREAAAALTPKDDDNDVLGVQLLGDLKALFDRGEDRLSSASIAEELVKLEGRPWGESCVRFVFFDTGLLA